MMSIARVTGAVALLMAFTLSAQAQLRQNDEWMCEGTPGKLQIEACTRVLQNWPTPNWFYHRAMGFNSIGDYESGIADLTEVLKKDATDWRSFESRGAMYFHAKEYQWAIRDYRQALSIKPDSAFALEGLGRAYDMLGHKKEAAEFYSQALAIEPKSAGLLNQLCWNIATSGSRFADGLDYCNRSLAIDPSANTFDSRALVNFQLGNYAAAISDGSAALAKNPKAASSLFVRGVAKLRAGDKSGGDLDIAAARKIAPDIVEVYAGYGVAP